MDGTMSQEEINALLNNPSGTDENPENTLTEQEKDAMRRVALHPLLEGRPFILETPNDDEGYRREIQKVREWTR